MFVPSGHLAIRKARQGRKEGKRAQATVYYFDVEKCMICPLKDGCYKSSAKSKTYSVSITSETHKEQALFQETEYFKENMKERYKVEQKNADLKNNLGFKKTQNLGIFGMSLQAATTLFVANIRRIRVLEAQEKE